MGKEKQKYLEVRVRGKNPVLWKELRAKFIDKIIAIVEELMEEEVDSLHQTTGQNERIEVNLGVVKQIKSRLAKPGIENEKLLVEIQALYWKMEKVALSNRKNKAEAKSLELKNKLNQIEISLGLTKIIAVQDKSEDIVIFLKEVDEWMALVRNLKKNYI